MLSQQSPFELSEWLELDQADPLVLRKEVLYADSFEKRDKHGVLEYKFGITPDILDHLSLSVDALIKNGVEIPYASKHAGWELAENRWGDVIAPFRGKNDKGKDALFLDVRFSDEESKRAGLKANVSVGIPPLFVDGLGRRYTNPVRHLAATSAPVIPALSGWQAIAASFDDEAFVPIIGDLSMPFPEKKPAAGQTPPPGEGDKGAAPPAPDQGGQQGNRPASGQNSFDGAPSIFDQILQILELQVPDSADDNAKGVAVLTALQMLKGKRTMNQQQQPAPGAQQQVPGGPQKPAPAMGGGIQLSSETSPLVIDMVRQNRELQLSHLVENEILDPNAAKELMKLFGTPVAIGLELSQGGDGSQFTQLVGILAANKPIPKAGRSSEFNSDKEVLLSHENKGGLTAMADKRVEEHEKRYGKAV